MALRASNLRVGDSHEEVIVDDLTRTQLVMYAGASGDYNPLHTDEIYTREVAGYPTVFAHGMLTMGLTGKMLTNYVGDGRLRKFGVRFTNQVWPGDTLTTKTTVKEIQKTQESWLVNLDIQTQNQTGITVISGYATAQIDP